MLLLQQQIFRRVGAPPAPSDNPRSRFVGCGSMSFRLDSDALVMVVRSPRVRVGCCRPFCREGSAHNAGATRDLALTMMRAWEVISLKFVRSAYSVAVIVPGRTIGTRAGG